MTALHHLHHLLTAALPHAGTRQLADGATAAELQLEAEYALRVEQPIRSTYAYALTGITEVEDEDEETIAEWMRRRFDDDPAATAALVALLYLFGRRAFELGGRYGLEALGVAGATFTLTNTALLDGLMDYAEGLTDPYADISLTNTTAVEAARRFARGREEGLAAGDIVAGMGAYVAARSLARSADVAETESVRGSRYGMLETFSRNEVRAYDYYTQDDDDVCPICDPYHLRRFTEEQYARISSLIPQHPYCRCFWVPVLVGWQQPEEIWTGA